MNISVRVMGCVLAVALTGCLVPVDAGHNDGGHGGGSAGGGSAGGGSAGGGSAGGGSAGGGSAGGGSVTGGVCTLGKDQTCNADPAVSALYGKCLAFAESGGAFTYCACNPGAAIDPATQKCVQQLQPSCTTVGDFGPCAPPGATSARGLCAPDNACFCYQGFVKDPSTGRCVNATPGCAGAGAGACNGDPTMSSFAGVCTLLGDADGCDCIDGYDSRDTSGKCFGAGRDGGVVEYALKPLATGLERIQVQRDDPKTHHCAVIGLVRSGGQSMFPRVKITTAGSSGAPPPADSGIGDRPTGDGGVVPVQPPWTVEHIRYGDSPCNSSAFNDSAAQLVAASFADGTIAFSANGASAKVNVNVFFPQTGTQPVAPMKLRFIADQVVLPLP